MDSEQSSLPMSCRSGVGSDFESSVTIRIMITGIIITRETSHVAIDPVNAHFHKRIELFCATILLTCAILGSCTFVVQLAAKAEQQRGNGKQICIAARRKTSWTSFP